MTTYYADTSALVKRYVDEEGSAWLRATLEAQPSPSIVVVHLLLVEVTSALTRRVREGVLIPTEYSQMQDAFGHDCLNDWEIVVAVGEVIDQAHRLLEARPLAHMIPCIWRRLWCPIDSYSTTNLLRSRFCAPMIVWST